ncbi:MAG: hypothetical protein PWP23_3337 [Candidatus Sumerlaeota bacterium]|nr:hypothetical protein [Candidatus Sumerlaeota bacterium]
MHIPSLHRLAAPLTLLLLLVAAAPAQFMPTGPKPPVPVGEKFPNFSGKTMDGKEIALADYHGKVTLVDFWATWCGPCMAEMPSVRKLYEEYHPKGFEILAVSLDYEKEDLASYYESSSLPWPSLFDGLGYEGPITTKFNVNSIPRTYLIGKEGELLAFNPRGSELWTVVAQHVDPEGPQPPNYDTLFARYAEAPAEERAVLAEQAMKFAAFFPHEIFFNVQEVLKNEKLDSETLALAHRLVTEGAEDNSPAALGISALASWRTGNSTQARDYQHAMFEKVVKQVRSRYGHDPEVKALGDEELFVIVTGDPELIARLALFEATAGNMERARELLPHFVESDNTYAVQAREKIAAAEEKKSDG